MNQNSSKIDRVYSRTEEIAHSASHGVGFLAVLAGSPFLITEAMHRGGAAGIAGVCVFAITAALLYLASTIYHAMPEGSRAKEICEVTDHAAIFLLIAGTYTPFTLGVLRGTVGWTLFGIVWALALGGVILKSIHGVRYPKTSLAIYIGMGWLLLFAIKPLIANMAAPGLAWLAGGGIAYTVGCFFYTHRQLRFGHFVWHLFVLAGTACHYFAILWYGF